MIHTRKTFRGKHHSRTASEINLRLLDFGRQHVMPVEEIVAVLDQLPTHHLARLTKIEYDPDRSSQWEIAAENPRLADFTCHGAYFPNLRKIVIYDIGQRAHFLHVLLHEIGHHVYHRVISGTQRGTWLKLWREQCAAARPAENADEYFAECYAYFITKKPFTCTSKIKRFLSALL